MPIPPPEVKRVLDQIQLELLRLVDANEIGTVTIHCGANQLVVEVNRKLDPVKREGKPQAPRPTNWK